MRLRFRVSSLQQNKKKSGRFTNALATSVRRTAGRWDFQPAASTTTSGSTMSRFNPRGIGNSGVYTVIHPNHDDGRLQNAAVSSTWSYMVVPGRSE
jgi:hypothetical protein